MARSPADAAKRLEREGDPVKFGRKIFESVPEVRIFHTRERITEAEDLPVLGDQEGVLLSVLLHGEQERVARRMMERQRDTITLAMGVRGEAGAEEHPLVRLVRELEGVEYVKAFAYSLLIVRGRLFSWEELEPGILRAMGTFSLGLPEA